MLTVAVSTTWIGNLIPSQRSTGRWYKSTASSRSRLWDTCSNWRHNQTAAHSKKSIPRSGDNPELCWGYDTEIVSHLIAVVAPVLWHVFAKETQHRGAEVPEGGVAFVVGDVPVHQPP
jgi:hypothetical protein